jgi:ATP phosphoribosyltransferase
MSTMMSAVPAAGVPSVAPRLSTMGATLVANGLKVLEDGVILRSEANLVASKMAAWPQETKKTCERLLARLKISAAAV